MRSSKTPEFDELLARLPEEVQSQAREAFRLWLANPYHPGLHFERIGGRRELCSVRVTRNYRAVGRYTSPDAVNWF